MQIDGIIQKYDLTAKITHLQHLLPQTISIVSARKHRAQ